MFISPAYAQTAGDAGGLVTTIIPFVLIFAIMWLLLIRPQQKKMKEHRAMVDNLRRGDQVVTAGGIVGKVAKVKEDGEIEVEIAEGVKVRIVRQTITAVVSKPEPAKDKECAARRTAGVRPIPLPLNPRLHDAANLTLEAPLDRDDLPWRRFLLDAKSVLRPRRAPQ